MGSAVVDGSDTCELSQVGTGNRTAGLPPQPPATFYDGSSNLVHAKHTTEQYPQTKRPFFLHWRKFEIFYFGHLVCMLLR